MNGMIALTGRPRTGVHIAHAVCWNARSRSDTPTAAPKVRQSDPARTAECAEAGQRGTSRHQSMGEAPGNITLLLRAAASGERNDLDALMHAIYDDMRRLAMSHMRSERDDHTLQPTALVHEAYVKLVDQRSTDWKDRVHFFAVASRIIRRILIDHARERNALKRGGAGERIKLDENDVLAPAASLDLIALDEAMAELAELDERQAKIVELRFFGGCSIEEIAELLQMGRRSVDREWQGAKAWLYCRLQDDDNRRRDESSAERGDA